MECIKCKNTIPDKSTYCYLCGKKQLSTSQKRTRKRPN